MEWWDANEEDGRIRHTLPTNVKKKYFFTYWNSIDEKYIWIPLGSGPDDKPFYLNVSWIPPNLPITLSIFERWLDIFRWDLIEPVYQGIRWNDVWRTMDKMRTGEERKFVYYEGVRSSYVNSVPFIAFKGDLSFKKESERHESYTRPSMGPGDHDFYDTYDYLDDDFSCDYYSGY